MEKNQHEQHEGNILLYFRQTMRIMRLSVFFMVVGTAIAWSATTYSQSTKLSVNLKDATVREVIEAIEEQSEFLFLFQEGQVDLNRHVSIRAEGKQLQEILDEVFRGTDNIYIVSDRQVVIGKAPRKNLEAQLSALQKGMKVSLIQQQQKEITGKVTDVRGRPLSDVTVIVKGTTIGTMTNDKGEFSLRIPSDAETLRFSFIGMKTKEVPIAGKTMFTVILEEDITHLEEFVAVGYQTVRKEDVHGAVASIKMEELQGITSSSVDAMLQGALSGVNIQIPTGEPGGRVTFNIRGNTYALDPDIISEPLFVLDGVPVDPDVVGYSVASTNFLTNINPNDIESIEVLKDAAATSIYGSRGANGVVLIKTKRGQVGKPKLNFNGRYGLAFEPRFPRAYLGVAERRERLKIFSARASYLELSELPLILTDSLNPAFNNNVDWYGLLCRTAITHNYNLTLSGGTDLMNYRFGGGYYNQAGTMYGTGYQRLSMSGNLINRIGKFEFNTNVSYTRGTRQALLSNPVTNAVQTGTSAMPSSLFYLDPVDLKRYKGKYTDIRNDNADENIRLSELIELRIFEWLLFSSNSSYSSNSSRRDLFSPSTLSIEGKSTASSTSNRIESMNFDNTFNFDKVFNSHRISGVAGISASKSINHYTYAGGSYLPSDLVKVITGVSQENLEASSDFSESGLVGMFARAQYYYKNRFSLFASVRRDGSSKLHKSNRWGTFPAFGAFWKFSDEPFMQNIKNVLSFAKVRISYGFSGKQPGGNAYGYTNRYVIGGTYDGESTVTPNFSDGVAQRDLQWESTKELDLGVDIELYKGRFFFQADYYHKNSDNLFYTLDMPVTSGYSRYNTNCFGVLNSGIEIMFRANILPADIRDWKWSVTLNASHNENVVTKLPFGNKTIESGRYLTVGFPMNQFKYAIYDGVYPTDDDVPINPYTGEKYLAEMGKPFRGGDAILRDIDGNYRWVSYQDLTNVGNPYPKVVGGLSTSVSWKDLTCDIRCSFTLGRDVYNQTLEKILRPGVGGSDELGRAFSNRGSGTTYAGIHDFEARRMLVDLSGMKFWEKPGDIADYPTLSYTTVPNFKSSTMYMENGSYFKMNSIMLSYRIPAFKGNAGISNMRISATAENIFVLKAKKSRIADPENVSSSGYYSGNGYGLSRLLTFGLQFDF